MDLLDNSDAQHRAMRVVNQGEWNLFLNERERQLLAVEVPRPLRIGSGNEADDAVIGEPELFRHNANDERPGGLSQDCSCAIMYRQCDTASLQNMIPEAACGCRRWRTNIRVG